jgi:CP family cyanate transporter-like MFS transporter
MNLETEKSMHRSDLSTASKRSAELEELLIDAEADDEQVQQTHPVLRRPWLLLLGLILVALNLRPALSSMAPMLSEVSKSLGLSASAAGLLTTLPVLCLGLFAPLARAGAAFGAEVLGSLMLAGGIILRSSSARYRLPQRAGASIGVSAAAPHCQAIETGSTMTGVYTMAQCLARPWRLSDRAVEISTKAAGPRVWVVPALVGVFWLPQVGQKHGAQRAYRSGD